MNYSVKSIDKIKRQVHDVVNHVPKKVKAMTNLIKGRRPYRSSDFLKEKD
jgi:hypothetical protein